MLSADAAEVGAGASTRVSKTDFSLAGRGAPTGCCAVGGAAGCGTTAGGVAGSGMPGGGAGGAAGTSAGSGADGSEGSAPGGPAGLPEETEAGSGGGSAWACAPLPIRTSTMLIRTDARKDVRARARLARKDEGMEVPEDDGVVASDARNVDCRYGAPGTSGSRHRGRTGARQVGSSVISTWRRTAVTLRVTAAAEMAS
jgi:hypothetical protein